MSPGRQLPYAPTWTGMQEPATRAKPHRELDPRAILLLQPGIRFAVQVVPRDLLGSSLVGQCQSGLEAERWHPAGGLRDQPGYALYAARHVGDDARLGSATTFGMRVRSEY